MAQQTLKRQEPTSTNGSDCLNDDDLDGTWGGKRPRLRYIYSFKIESSDDDSSTSCVQGTDDTESVYSIQSKTTLEMCSDDDLSGSCRTDCSGCQNSSDTNFTEFDIRSSSSSCHYIDSNSSDSSTTFNFKTEKNYTLNGKSLPSSDGYLPDDTDNLDLNDNIKLPPPACFKTCLQCKKDNPNPYFQYCYTCFRFRSEYFEQKPKRRSIKVLNASTKEGNSLNDSEESCLPNSQESYPISQEANVTSKNIEISIAEVDGNSNNVCNICLVMPKNGIINHGKIGHVYSCYSCAKKLWKKSKKCPLCNVKIKFVTRMITV